MTYALSAYSFLADGPVKSEIRRIARKLVKDELKAKGVKLCTVEAADIAKAAEELLSDKATADKIFKLAKRNLPRTKPHRRAKP